MNQCIRITSTKLRPLHQRTTQHNSRPNHLASNLLTYLLVLIAESRRRGDHDVQRCVANYKNIKTSDAAAAAAEHTHVSKMECQTSYHRYSCMTAARHSGTLRYVTSVYVTMATTGAPAAN